MLPQQRKALLLARTTSKSLGLAQVMAGGLMCVLLSRRLWSCLNFYACCNCRAHTACLAVALIDFNPKRRMTFQALARTNHGLTLILATCHRLHHPHYQLYELCLCSHVHALCGPVHVLLCMQAPRFQTKAAAVVPGPGQYSADAPLVKKSYNMTIVLEEQRASMARRL